MSVAIGRVVVTGGGTGGHLYPALSVAEALHARHGGWELHYVGGERGIESQVIGAGQYEFLKPLYLESEGMPRSRNWREWRHWLKLMLKSLWRALWYLIRNRIDVVFATGGYVTGPVLVAAWLLRKPYVLLEPDAHPGVVNKWMAGGAHTVCVAFEKTLEALSRGADVRLTGNPTKARLGDIRHTEALEWARDEGARTWWLEDQHRQQTATDQPVSFPKTLLVMGGSQGSRALNEAVVMCLEQFLNEAGWRVIHITGRKLYQETVMRIPQHHRFHPNYWVMPYSNDMPYLLALADLAVARAGSLSLSEFALAGVPAVLVPFPHAAADHQTHNARALEHAGAAICLPESDLTPSRLFAEVQGCLSDDDRLETMRRMMASLAKPDATAHIVGVLEQVVSEAC